MQGNLSNERMQAFEKAIVEDEELQLQVNTRRLELKAYGRLEEYFREEEQSALPHKTWLASLFSSAMLIGSYWAQAKSYESKEGRSKTDKKDLAPPGAGS